MSINVKDFSFTGAKIKLLGDSITHGVGGSGFAQNGEHIVENFARNKDGFCWAKLFGEKMEKEYGARVVNNACTGTRIEFVIKHLDTLVEDDDDIIICTIGTNNRHQYMSDGPKRSREEHSDAFYKNILTLSGMLKDRKKKFVLIANIPASSQNEKDGADFWRILHMNDINDLYKRAREVAGFEFISMYDLFSSYVAQSGVELDSFLKDGLHPNDEGYRVMFGLMCNALGV